MSEVKQTARPGITAQQLRIARAALGLSRSELAQICNLRLSDIVMAESGGRSHDTTRRDIQIALEACGIEFALNGWVRHLSDAAVPAPETPPPLPDSRPAQTAFAPPPTEAGSKPWEVGAKVAPHLTLAQEIGAACRRARLSQELELGEMCKNAGINPLSYLRIENGYVLPSIPTLLSIAQVLGLDLEVLKEIPLPVFPQYEISSNALGALCRQGRERRNLHQADMARILGISVEHYREIELGRLQPSLGLFCALLREAEIDTKELAGKVLRPDYVKAFEQLWGSLRDVFAGVPRDERGIPMMEEPRDQRG